MSTNTFTTETGTRAGLVTMTGGLLLAAAYLVDAATGAFTIEGVPGSNEWLVAYGLLAVAAFLLAAGLAGIAWGYRRRFGRLTVAGLALSAVGFLSVAVGSMLNLGYDGAAGDTTTGGGFAFVGFLVIALGAVVTGLALWRTDAFRTAAGSLLAGVVVAVLGFVVGTTVTDVVGFDLVWLLAWLLVASGWTLFGNAVRVGNDSVTTERVAPAV